MRAVPITVAALAAALLLTGCSSSDDSGSGGASGTDSKAAGGACASDGLDQRVDASAAPGAGDTGTVTVTITNKGAECTLDGFPAVDLYTDGTSASVPEDSGAEAQKITLAAQGTASFTITYARGESGGKRSLAVKTVKYALPGEQRTEDFDWSYGDVALKDGDEPDASVSAFQQAGD